MKKGISLLLCFLLLLFLIAAPGFIAGGIEKNIFSTWQKKQSEQYRGTLEMWHVVSFKTAEKSGYEYLKNQCTIFEKNTPYVFIRLRGMTVETARDLLEQGKTPDVISYPIGFLDESCLMCTEIPEGLLKNLQPIADTGVPYMADSYVAVLNQNLLWECGVRDEYSEELTQRTVAEIFEKVNNPEKGIFSVALTDADGRSPKKAWDFAKFAVDEFTERKHFSLGETADTEIFCKGKAGMLLCPYSEYRNLAKKNVNFSYKAYAFTDYTDLIQKIGIFESEDARKNEMMQRFIERIFTDRAQKEICELGMFPCKKLGNLYTEDVQREEAYLRFCEKAVIPS